MQNIRRNLAATAALALLMSATTLLAGAPAEAKGVTIKKATFGKGVTDDFKIKDATTSFAAKDRVWLLVQIKGRPKSGKLSSRWTFRGNSMGEAAVDFATVNKGVLFSFGEDTYAKFDFTPGPDGMPIGVTYKVDLSLDGAPVGSYPFAVIPPASATVSKMTTVSLSDKRDGPAKSTFGPATEVFVSFTGDFGITTWMEAQWTIGGKVDDSGTRSLTMQESKSGVSGYFSYVPKGGFPKGKHSVRLFLNDVVVGTYPFTIA